MRVEGAKEDFFTRHFIKGIGGGERDDGLGHRTLGLTTSIEGFVRLESTEGFPIQPSPSAAAGHACAPVLFHALKAGDETTKPDEVSAEMTDGIYNTPEGLRSGIKVPY